MEHCHSNAGSMLKGAVWRVKSYATLLHRRRAGIRVGTWSFLASQRSAMSCPSRTKIPRHKADVLNAGDQRLRAAPNPHWTGQRAWMSAT